MSTMDRSDKLWSAVEVTRRSLLGSGRLSGAVADDAVATLPVRAETPMLTDTDGLDAGMIAVPVGIGTIPAYRAMPQEGRNRPLVLVVQEVFGVHEHIKDICRRFAKLGYCAIAPELFHRQGDVTKLEALDEIRKIVAAVPDESVMADLDAAVKWAKDAAVGDVTRLGIAGFRWGGRIVWLYAAHNPSVRAGVAWYGRLVGEKSRRNPEHPVDVANRITGSVLGLYGGEDACISVSAVEQMRAALGEGSRSQIHVYPGTPPDFFADYRPSYRNDAAEDGWKRCLAWFKSHGVA